MNRDEKFHIPVLTAEILDFFKLLRLHLKDREPLFVDGTLGDGGHTLLFLKEFPEARILAFDRDPDMVTRATGRITESGYPVENVTKAFLKMIKNPSEVRPTERGKIPERDKPAKSHQIRDFLPARVNIIRSESYNAAAILRSIDLLPDFILMDLGVSSYHFLEANRGFSYQDEKMDMRLNPDIPENALDLLNHLELNQLISIFHDFGEERYSRRIAKAVVNARPIQSAAGLADLVLKSIPTQFTRKKSRRSDDPARIYRSSGSIHPATRVFQALRIAVNDELNILKESLVQLPLIVSPGGLFAVISFHSLEDRVVKQSFRFLGEKKKRVKTSYDNELEKQIQKTGMEENGPHFWILTPKPIRPAADEMDANRASRSARLRVLQRKLREPHSYLYISGVVSAFQNFRNSRI